ncbi:MAG: B12-binding domain-containing radical SAM protein [bacterium]|nr:B12-binding domain-containing radical SAM protein [bacterium]
MNDKVLLVLLPYWVPLIPPMGISCLKSYLEAHEVHVTTVDANVDSRFQELTDRYFNRLKEFVPMEKQGNVHNLGNEVLRHHLMAHLNFSEGKATEKEYLALVSLLVEKTFFTAVDAGRAGLLKEIIETFYSRLREYVKELLAKEKPSVLGLTAYTVNLPAVLLAFKMAKEIDPGIKTVMGGGIFSGELDMKSPNFTTFLEQTPFIDNIIVGEGEALFLKYLKGELPPGQRVYTLADIGNETLDLAEAKAVDFTGLDLRLYPTMASYTSRSCPFNCSFCSEKVMWGHYRKKKGAQIAAELKELSDKYNAQLFLMADSLLNPVVKDLSQAIIDEGLSIYWDGYLRADPAVCNTDNTFQWRQGGFYRARLGLESGSPKILEAMGKKISSQQIKEAVGSLAAAGIKTTTYWVIGHPGETEEDFQQTLRLIEEMKDEIYEADCNPFMFFPAGQVDSDHWAHDNRPELLYPPESRDLLMLQTWFLNTEPYRDEIYKRVNRFVAFCREIGIPNPYSLLDIHKADERWKNLHSNAVPPLAEFLDAKNKGAISINENKGVKKVVYGNTIDEDLTEDWGF